MFCDHSYNTQILHILKVGIERSRENMQNIHNICKTTSFSLSAIILKKLTKHAFTLYSFAGPEDNFFCNIVFKCVAHLIGPVVDRVWVVDLPAHACYHLGGGPDHSLHRLNPGSLRKPQSVNSQNS